MVSSGGSRHSIGGGGGGEHEMRLNAKGTVGSFGGRKLIYNKIITPPPLDPPLVSLCAQNQCVSFLWPHEFIFLLVAYTLFERTVNMKNLCL